MVQTGVYPKERGVSGPLGLWEQRQGLGHDLCVQSSSLSLSDSFILFADFFTPCLTPHWLATREGLLLFPHKGFRRFWKGPWMAQSGWVDTQVELSPVALEGRVTQDSSVCFWGLSQRRSGSHETGNYHTASTTEMKTPLFSCSVISDSLWPHGLQHTRLHYPSPSPRVCSSSCPLSWWCHPTISFSVVPFSSCPQSFPASGSFPMSQICASGGQSIGASTSASALSKNTQGWFPLGLTGCISLQFKGLSRVFSSTIVWRHKFFDAQPFLLSSSYTYMNTGKTIALTIQTFVRKVISLLFNMLSKYLSLLFFQGASIF